MHAMSRDSWRMSSARTTRGIHSLVGPWSCPVANTAVAALYNLTPLQQLLVGGSTTMLALVAALQAYYLRLFGRNVRDVCTADDAVVTRSVATNFLRIGAIALPTWRCREGLGMLVFVALFALKAYLRVRISRANGEVLATMLHGKPGNRLFRFVQRVSVRTALSCLAAVCSGAIEGLRMWLIASFRCRLSRTFQRRFYHHLVFYQATILDNRLEAADTAIATYCAEFAEHFAELPYYFVMPGLGCAMSSYALARQAGARAAGLMCAVVTLSVLLLRRLSPEFGRICAYMVTREDDYRRMLTSDLYNVENIAMYKAGEYTRRRLDASLQRLRHALTHMALAKANFEMLESLFTSFLSIAASMVAFDGARRSAFRRPVSELYLEINLIEDLNASVKDFVVNFRELSHISAFTTRLGEFDATLRSIAAGTLMCGGGSNTTTAAAAGLTSGGSDTEMTPTTTTTAAAAAGCVPQPLADGAQLQLPALDKAALSSGSDAARDEAAMSTASHAVSSPRQYTRIHHMPRTAADDGVYTIIDMQHVTLHSPAGQVLLDDVTLSMRSDEDWVITGENGSGKTSLLRMFAGLWLPTRGRLSICRDVVFLFAPQHCYMVPQCTLYEQICFPHTPPAATTEVRALVQQAIELAGAQTVVRVIGGYGSPVMGLHPDHVDESYDWSCLSGGQRQRVSMARIFFQVLCSDRAKVTLVAVLDEATSMMDDTEQEVLAHLRRMNVRMLSVTHRDAVVRHHTRVLHISRDGSWSAEDVRDQVVLSAPTSPAAATASTTTPRTKTANGAMPSS